MKATSQSYPGLLYNEIVRQACQLWQQQGCEFGRYLACLQQAKLHLLVVGQTGNGLANNMAAKPKAHRHSPRTCRTGRTHRLNGAIAGAGSHRHPGAGE